MSDVAVYQQRIHEYGNRFTVDEFEPVHEGSITRIQLAFFNQFLAFRKWLGLPMMVTSAWREGNSGAHPKGLAIDTIPFNSWMDTVADPVHQWTAATTFGFQGVGIYFDWKYYKDGKKQPAVGLHLDGWNSSKRPLRWFRTGGQYYFYQNVVDGRFYCDELNESLTFDQALKKYCEL